jgi:DNA topoisomerase VI subunit B
VLEQEGQALDTAQYYIDPENSVHVTQILRNLYSDPMLAVFREYVTNALDAHVLAGLDDSTQIEIHVPTAAEPWLSVRDFGGGLNVEDTKKLLYGYGSSGDYKRVSNKYTGGFGIGCKSAFSMCTAFTYTIWNEGRKRVWSCYLDERDVGKADLVSDEPSAEASGVEVNIPIKVDVYDETKVYDKLDKVFRFQTHRPKLLNSDREISGGPDVLV